jgi:hypothetical protein
LCFQVIAIVYVVDMLLKLVLKVYMLVGNGYVVEFRK